MTVGVTTVAVDEMSAVVEISAVVAFHYYFTKH